MLKGFNPLLACDFYKACHHDQYPKTLTKLISYFTPRMSRLQHHNHLVMFGLQGFIKQYLIDFFNEFFFSRTKEDVVNEYVRVLDHTLGKGAYDIGKIGSLHDLGYLPLEIRALPEGSRVNVKTPMIEISNTHPDFVWLVNTIETLMSCSLWHTMVSANVGAFYRSIVNYYYDKTVDDCIPRAKALGDFSMRGQESLESAARSSAAFCLSFLNTATIPAIQYLENYYNCDCSKEPVAYGAISTEHSVMCSNFAVDGDEVSIIRRLLTEIYPNHSFSMVSDSYDYWNLIKKILPELKKEIMEHNGTLLIRGDSGDPVEIVTQTVFELWNTFGGTLNSKGFKVLDPHIKAIYGDSITPQRCEDIYEILMTNGFACNNVVLGVGSFSMQCLEEIVIDQPTKYPLKVMQPFTRDTYGIAVKSTYAEDANGNAIQIFKNPKTDTGSFKKSQKGCCSVHFDGRDFTYVDGLTSTQRDEDPANFLIPVFRDGKMAKEYTLQEIRDTLWRGKF